MVLVTGVYYVEDIFVHKANDDVDHCWFLGRKWDQSTITSSDIPYPLLQLSDVQAPYLVFHSSDILNIALCTHFCANITFNKEEFNNSLENVNVTPLCYVQLGVTFVHNTRQNVFIQQPNNTS